MMKRIVMLAALALPFVVSAVAQAQDDAAKPAKKAKKGKKAKKDAMMDDSKKADAPAAGGDAKPADAPANP